MGANKNLDLQKCGELLIDIEKIRHKTKSYTYRCAFCGDDCEQLKKFTKHLEDKHFLNFEEDLKKYDPVKIESGSSNLSVDLEDFKAEQQMFIKANDDNISTKGGITSNMHSDPLNMFNIKTDINDLVENNTNEHSIFEIDNRENEIHDLEADGNVSTDELESDKEIDDNDINCKVKRNFQRIKTKYKKKSYITDVSSDNSDDSDFKTEKHLKSKKKLKNHKKGSDVGNQDSSQKVGDNENPSSWHIYKQFLPLFIEQYKKYEQLWKVDNIAFGVKPVRWKILSKIADEIKLDLKTNISVRGVHINIMYLNRLYSKDKKQELLCKMENKKFIPESDLYTELSSFLSESQGPFLCSICNKMIAKYDPYCIHMAEHNGTQPFKCTTCGMTFTKLHKYKIHKKRHLGVYNHHCNVCGKGYLFQSELDYHLTSHNGLKPFLCPICGERFRQRQYYANHMLRHENRFRHECHICKKGFMYTQALNSHIKSHSKC